MKSIVLALILTSATASEVPQDEEIIVRLKRADVATCEADDCILISKSRLSAYLAKRLAEMEKQARQDAEKFFSRES